MTQILGLAHGLIYRLNIALWRRILQTLNGYFFVINDNASGFLVAMRRLSYITEVVKKWLSTRLFCLRKSHFPF